MSRLTKAQSVNYEMRGAVSISEDKKREEYGPDYGLSDLRVWIWKQVEVRKKRQAIYDGNRTRK